MKVDVNKEKEFKDSLISKLKVDSKDVIEYKAISLKEKERIEKEKYMNEKLDIQNAREKERKTEIDAQMKQLQKKERELQEEIMNLQQLRTVPVKPPGKK